MTFFCCCYCCLFSFSLGPIPGYAKDLFLVLHSEVIPGSTQVRVCALCQGLVLPRVGMWEASILPTVLSHQFQVRSLHCIVRECRSVLWGRSGASWLNHLHSVLAVSLHPSLKFQNPLSLERTDISRYLPENGDSWLLFFPSSGVASVLSWTDIFLFLSPHNSFL